jgi:hypothetical protein
LGKWIHTYVEHVFSTMQPIKTSFVEYGFFLFFCRLFMCESVTCCEGPTHNWHIFLSHWARSLPQDWDPSCHDPLLWGIHVMVLLEMCL